MILSNSGPTELLKRNHMIPNKYSPYFSICIPQFNRTDFLIESLKSFADQNFKDFEVCISDGGSTDDGYLRIKNFLNDSGLNYVLSTSDTSLRYDSNLRKSISLSSGKYVLLMGNDDLLLHKYTLTNLRNTLEDNQPIGVAVTNYQELSSGKVFRRIQYTSKVGSGPLVASKVFRRYSFVSGIVLDGKSARLYETDLCDGSEMYQMYLASRIIASGEFFLGINDVCIGKDIQIEGLTVDSYKNRERISPCPLLVRFLPMGRIFETVLRGIKYADPNSIEIQSAVSIANQLYFFTYPYWVIEYRRLQSFKFSLGVYLALRPNIILISMKFPFSRRLYFWLIYIFLGIIALFLPIKVYDKLMPTLYKIAKK